MEETSIASLNCGIQNYDWGVYGFQSLVASLKHNSDKNYIIYNNLPYAELWMGSHPRMESMVSTSDGYVPLSQYLEDNSLPELKFLFKVLSVDQALSIQVHPDKNKAVFLHSNFPDNYSDSNHKPEMAIAISKFSALIGFRKWSEIHDLTCNIRSFHKFIENVDKIGDEATDMKSIISSAVALEPYFLQEIINDILCFGGEKPVVELFRQLFERYQYDVGCLFAFFMNYVELEPGQALVIGPNVPHCYLKGDIVECMANSDNVVRLGLTNKFRDVDTLLEITDFKPSNLDQYKPKIVAIKSNDDRAQISRYVSGFKEFNIVRIKISKDVEFITLPVISSSLLIVIDGSSKLRIEAKYGQSLGMKRGDVRFIKHDGKLTFEEIDEDILAFIAEPNDEY